MYDLPGRHSSTFMPKILLTSLSAIFCLAVIFPAAPSFLVVHIYRVQRLHSVGAWTFLISMSFILRLFRAPPTSTPSPSSIHVGVVDITWAMAHGHPARSDGRVRRFFYEFCRQWRKLSSLPPPYCMFFITPR